MSESAGLSSLTLSLLLLAVVAVVGVLAFNAWSARRRQTGLRDRVAVTGASEPATAEPVGGLRAEPSFGRPASPQGEADLRVSSVGPIGQDAVAPERAEASPAAPRLSPLTDCIVEFQLDEPVPAERLMPTVARFRRVGGKPVLIEAAAAPAPDVPVDDTPRPEGEVPEPDWTPLAARQRFQRLRVGVLLANRNGPLNAMEYSEFVSGVQAIAEQLALLGDTPDMDSVLRRARALDESCAALDAQIGLNVQSPEPLSVDDLSRLAREAGCLERGNNRYARLGPRGEVLFSIALGDAPERLSLLLDVPRAPVAAQPWEQMLACARLCASRLDGRLVDDEGRALAETTLALIGEQLATRQQALSEAGLQPGSPSALRIFN